MKLGNRYENSVNLLYRVGNPWVLVHGIVTGTSGIIKGMKYGHAWLEHNGIVLDVEQNATGKQSEYYELGQIEYCKKYSLSEMRSQLLINETFGPWDEIIFAADTKAWEILKYGLST